MKKIVLALTTLLLPFGAFAQTATNFNCNDCAGNNHDLFTELDAGKVVVIAWVMPCSSCLGPTLTASNIVQSYATSNPGQVVLYVADDYANTNCVSLTSWVTSNGITATTFSNSAIDMTDYGSAGMPKIVVLGGGTAHTVFFNQNNSAAGNATALQSAIDSALVTSINEAAGSLQDFTIAPNPVDEGTTVKLNMNRSAEITIDVYNQSGQVVLNVFGGAMAPGESSVVINTAELAEGIYFVQIGEAEKCSVQKMVVTHK